MHHSAGRLTRVRTTARRLDIQYKAADPAAPPEVVVLFGPNGSGKTTVLQSIVCGVAGTVLVGGKAMKSLPKVFGMLSPEPGDVRMRLEFQQNFVERSLVGTAAEGVDDDGEPKISVTTKLRTSFAPPGCSASVGGGAVLAALGNPALFDVQAFLSLGPKERQTRLMELCASVAPPWAGSRVVERLAAHLRRLIGVSTDELADAARMTRSFNAAFGQPLDQPQIASEVAIRLFTAGEDDFYVTLKAHVERAAKRAAENAKEVKRCAAAVERLNEDAAKFGQEVHGTPEALDATISRLNQELERLARDLGEAEGAHERRTSITGEIARLEALTAQPVEEYEKAVGAAREAREGAASELQRLGTDSTEAPAPDPELPELERLRGEVADTIAELESRRAPAAHEVAALTRSIEALRQHAGEPGETRACPLCRGELRAEDVDRLDQMRGDATAALALQDEQIARKRAELDRVDRDIREIRDEEHHRALRHSEETGRLRQRRRDLEVQLVEEGPLDTALRTAEAALVARRGSALRHETLSRDLAGLAALDVQKIQQSIDGARKERDEATERRRAIVEATERRRTRQRAIADRDAAQGAQADFDAAVAAWTTTFEEYGQQAMAPFIATVQSLAPDGWAFRGDIGKAAFYVTKPKRPEVPIVALSNGEQSLFFPAFGAALARASGARFRAVLADGAEAMQSEPAAGAPRGVFLRFIEGLRAVAHAGHIDQAFVATARLTDEERQALEEMDGVQLVELTDPGEPAQVSYSATDVQRIRASVATLSTAGMRRLYRDHLHVEIESVPLMRAHAVRHIANLGWPADRAVDVCASLPQRGRADEPEEVAHVGC